MRKQVTRLNLRKDNEEKFLESVQVREIAVERGFSFEHSSICRWIAQRLPHHVQSLFPKDSYQMRLISLVGGGKYGSWEMFALICALDCALDRATGCTSKLYKKTGQKNNIEPRQNRVRSNLDDKSRRCALHKQMRLQEHGHK